jgi:hypothetical protein
VNDLSDLPFPRIDKVPPYASLEEAESKACAEVGRALTPDERLRLVATHTGIAGAVHQWAVLTARERFHAARSRGDEQATKDARAAYGERLREACESGFDMSIFLEELLGG